MPRCEKEVTTEEQKPQCDIQYTYNIPLPETDVYKRGYLQALKDLNSRLIAYRDTLAVINSRDTALEGIDYVKSIISDAIFKSEKVL